MARFESMRRRNISRFNCDTRALIFYQMRKEVLPLATSTPLEIVAIYHPDGGARVNDSRFSIPRIGIFFSVGPQKRVGERPRKSEPGPRIRLSAVKILFLYDITWDCTNTRLFYASALACHCNYSPVKAIASRMLLWDFVMQTHTLRVHLGQTQVFHDDCKNRVALK